MIGSKPLLTIAIPTWNRANTLKNALDVLLPQVLPFKDLLEVVISDNASDDETHDVIARFVESHSTLNIVHNRNNINLGYYGNFKKCKELSTGKYFWLLSDNDHLGINLLNFLVSQIQKVEPVALFLSDWGPGNNSKEVNYKSILYESEEGIRKFGHKTTLISSVIFLNKRENETDIFERFTGNSFLGYVLFLDSLNEGGDIVEIKGQSLFIEPTKVSFNPFYSFSVDLIDCLNYATEKKLITVSTKKSIINSAIQNVTLNHYLHYRIFGQVHGYKPKTKSELDDMLISGFSNFSAFENELKPLMHTHIVKIYFLFFKRKIFPALLKRIKL